ncbi:hypothetical protein NMY22_g6579 [Coprinellus aureogranulatus]|nr:hypothetical protein NMY22_g6579 [Coprinellus aureogranulatus]
MFQNVSDLRLGEASHIVAERYDDRSTNALEVSGAGHYSNNTEIRAQVYNRYDIHASSPLRELCNNIVVGALHNSAERCDAPKCHPETRKAVQGQIYGWITDGFVDGSRDTEPRQILWVTGPAGAGKTAIMGSVADECQKAGTLAASFFFSLSSGSPDRVSKQRFITTLAYQIQQLASLKGHMSSGILSTIDDDPAIFGRDLKVQMEALILKALRGLDWPCISTSPSPLVIVIDGLDECQGSPHHGHDSQRSKEADQLDILSVLLQALNDPTFPFRILIASRPEPWIRRFFSTSLQGRIAEIFLDDKYEPDKDIELFLLSKFAELRRRYHHLPSNWPSEDDLATLVTNASGQFIYATTVIRFVDNPAHPPQAQLGIVLTSKHTDSSNPLEPLDALYTSILLSSPRPEAAVLWLKAFLILRTSIGSGPVWFFERFCESHAGEAQLVLGLPSLMDVNGSYNFYHKSFLDFLQDPKRCQAFSGVDNKATEGLDMRPAFAQGFLTSRLGKQFLLSFFWVWKDFMASHQLPVDVLSHCNAHLWVSALGDDESIETRFVTYIFRKDIFTMVHANCCMYMPCLPVCRTWRTAISNFSKTLRPQPFVSNPTDLACVLDRFCVMKIPLLPLEDRQRLYQEHVCLGIAAESQALLENWRARFQFRHA